MDVLAYQPERKLTVAVQLTDGSNLAHRRSKLREERLAPWLVGVMRQQSKLMRLPRYEIVVEEIE